MSKLTIAAGAFALVGFTGKVHEQVPNDSAFSLVRPIYEALTASTPAEVRARLEAITSPDWENCSENDSCETREATITRWTARITLVPDFRFEVREVLAVGNKVVVRSEASGTPRGPFLGLEPKGRSFKIMTIDVHDVEAGKVVRTHHIEDWARAIRQLRGDIQ